MSRVVEIPGIEFVEFESHPSIPQSRGTPRVRICPIDYPDYEVEGFEWEYAQRLYDQF